MLGPEKDTSTCISSTSESCLCLLSQWVGWDLAEVSSPQAEAEKLRWPELHSLQDISPCACHDVESPWTHKEKNGPQPTGMPGWSLKTETMVPGVDTRITGHPNKRHLCGEKRSIGGGWSRRTCVRLWQERQRMTMKDHLSGQLPFSQPSVHTLWKNQPPLFVCSQMLSWILCHLTLPAFLSRCPILEFYCGHSLSSSMRTRKDPIWACQCFSKEQHEQIQDRAGDPGRPFQGTGSAIVLEKSSINSNPKSPNDDCYRFITLHAKNTMAQIYVPYRRKPWGWSSCIPWVW